MLKVPACLEEYRLRVGKYASASGDNWGSFELQGPCGKKLVIIAADATDALAEGWEHASVSTARRIPNWIEMCLVKNLFWAPQDCVVQFHPAHDDYINCHQHVLHLWRWTKGEFPMPPKILV